MLIYRDTDLGIEVSIDFDRWDAFYFRGERAVWKWQVSDLSHEVLAKGDDLTTVAPTSEINALQALGDFLDNWAYAVQKMEKTGNPIQEDIEKFPSSLFEAASGDVWLQFAEAIREATSQDIPCGGYAALGVAT